MHEKNDLDYWSLIHPLHCFHCYAPFCTFPFLPVWTYMMQARGHFVGAIGSSLKHTMSPMWRLHDGMCHLESFCRLLRYSVDQCCHACRTRAWHKHQCCNKYIELAGDSVSGKASRWSTTRKFPGIRASILSSGCERGVRGLEFKHTSICIRLVVSCSNLSSVREVCLISYFCMYQELYFAGDIYSCMVSYRVCWSCLVPDIPIPFRGLPSAGVRLSPGK